MAFNKKRRSLLWDSPAEYARPARVNDRIPSCTGCENFTPCTTGTCKGWCGRSRIEKTDGKRPGWCSKK